MSAVTKELGGSGGHTVGRIDAFAVASTSAVFSELWIPHGTCAKLPPTEAKVSANTILQ